MTAQPKHRRADRLGDSQIWALCDVLGISAGHFFDGAVSDDHGMAAVLLPLGFAASAPDDLDQAVAGLPLACRTRLAEIVCGIAAAAPGIGPGGLLPRQG